MRLTVLVRSRVDADVLVWTRRGLGLAAVVKSLALWTPLTWLAEPSSLRMPILPLPLGGGMAQAVIAVWVLCGMLLIRGWRSREAAATLSVLAGYLLLADRQLYSNHLYLLMLLYGLLAVALWQRSGGSIPYWPLFLVKTQASIVYGFAALAKLHAEYLVGAVLAASWMGGPVPDRWLVPMVMAPVAAGSVMVEVFLAVGLWTPRLRAPAVALGLLFHAAIVVTMAPRLELLAFALAMLALYPLFWVRTEVPGHRNAVLVGREG